MSMKPLTQDEVLEIFFFLSTKNKAKDYSKVRFHAECLQYENLYLSDIDAKPEIGWKQWIYNYEAKVSSELGHLVIAGELSLDSNDEFSIKTMRLDKFEFNGNECEGVHQFIESDYLKILAWSLIEQSRDGYNFSKDFQRYKEKDLFSYFADITNNNDIVWSNRLIENDDWEREDILDDFGYFMPEKASVYEASLGDEEYCIHIDYSDIEEELSYAYHCYLNDGIDIENYIVDLGDSVTIKVGDYLTITKKEYQWKEARLFVNRFNKKIIHLEDIVVKTDVSRCILKNHSLELVDAYISIFSVKDDVCMEVKVQAGYCHECDVYYITEAQFKELQSMGSLCCDLYTEEEYRNKCKGVYSENLKFESVLHQYGYNVSKTKGLSDEQRHRILLFVLRNGILTEDRIISHIEWLYNRNLNNSRMNDARKKWRNDIEFMRNNSAKSLYKTIQIGSIYRKEIHYIDE